MAARPGMDSITVCIEGTSRKPAKTHVPVWLGFSSMRVRMYLDNCGTL